MPAWPPDFWADAVLPPGHAAAVAKWRQMIVHSQRPTECARTCGLRPSVHIGGATQNLRRVAHALMQATLLDCSIRSPWPSSVFLHEVTSVELRDRCVAENRRSMECYFLPISNCTANATLAAASSSSGSSSIFRFLDAYADVSDMLDRVANVTGLRSELLVMGTLLSWIMRPRHELRGALEHYGVQLGLATPGLQHRYMGMHMRRGDKYSLHTRHMRDQAWRIEPSAFAIWGRRVSANLGMERVLYMSDDQTIDFEASDDSRGLFREAPAPAVCRPSSHSNASLGSMVKRATASSVLRSIRSKASTYGPLMRGVLSQRPECGSTLFADDGIQLYAGLMILAHGAAFIGTQISNVDMAIVELMATRRFPPAVYDVLNDVTRPFLSDEKVWFGASHEPQSTRSAAAERLARGDGTATHGCWAACEPADANKTAHSSRKKEKTHLPPS